MFFCFPQKTQQKLIKKKTQKMDNHFYSAFCWQNFVVFSDLAIYVIYPHQLRYPLNIGGLSVKCAKKRSSKIFFLESSTNMEKNLSTKLYLKQEVNYGHRLGNTKKV